MTCTKYSQEAFEKLNNSSEIEELRQASAQLYHSLTFKEPISIQEFAQTCTRFNRSELGEKWSETSSTISRTPTPEPLNILENIGEESVEVPKSYSTLESQVLLSKHKQPDLGGSSEKSQEALIKTAYNTDKEKENERQAQKSFIIGSLEETFRWSPTKF